MSMHARLRQLAAALALIGLTLLTPAHGLWHADAHRGAVAGSGVAFACSDAHASVAVGQDTDNPSDTPRHDPRAARDCAICLLLASIGLPLPPTTASPAASGVEVAARPDTYRQPRRVSCHVRVTRGPPHAV